MRRHVPTLAQPCLTLACALACQVWQLWPPRLREIEGARDEAVRLREASAAKARAEAEGLQGQLTEMAKGRAAAEAELEAARRRLEEDRDGEAARLAAVIAREGEHTAEARRQLEASRAEVGARRAWRHGGMAAWRHGRMAAWWHGACVVRV